MDRIAISIWRVSIAVLNWTFTCTQSARVFPSTCSPILRVYSSA